MKYINYGLFLSAALILGVFMTTNVYAQVSIPSTQSNGSTAGTISTPSTQSNGSTAGVISTPNTQGNGTTAGTISTPGTQSNGTTAGTNVPPTQGNGTTAGTNIPPTQSNGNTSGSNVPPTQGNGTTAGTDTGSGSDNGGNNNDGGSSSRGGSSSGSRPRNSAVAIQALPPLTSISDCLYLNTYLKYGWNNPVDATVKLQNFLRNNEGINVTTTGVFDLQTLSAVHAFQAKYLEDVMVPWGVRNTSGFVYYTTTKKINELYCKKNFALTSAQLAEIEAYRRNIQNPKTQTIDGVPVNVNPATGEPATTSDQIGSKNNASSSQVANAGEGFGTKIKNFFKWLFGIK